MSVEADAPPESARLARAYASLEAGDIARAARDCRTVLADNPLSPAAIHLLGLTAKARGDLGEAERLLARSIELEPAHADYRANLGNLLRRRGRLAAAERAYREALGLDPNHAAARLGLARTLNDLRRSADAEEQCRVLLALEPGDPLAWQALGMTLRDQARLPEAQRAYERAVRLGPTDGRAWLNLAALLISMERAEEAMQAIERVAACGLDGFELEFNRGRALTLLYRFDEAETAFARAVELFPADREAQLNLARLRYMRGDAGFARALAQAAASRTDPALRMLFADVLRRTGDCAGAEIILRDLTRALGPVPEVRSALAAVLQETGRLEEAEREALDAAAERPGDVAIAENLVSILLSRGRAHEARSFIEVRRRAAPLDQRWIAYEATAARLLGDPLYGRLYDYRRLVRVYDLAPPAGWASIDALNAALVRALADRHRLARHPFDQSLREGSQTARDLTTETDPAIAAVLDAFRGPVEDYRTALGADPAHPLSARNHGATRFAGCWSIELRRDGHHVNHLHPDGWLSSAYYVSVPSEVARGVRRAGWLKFGEPRFPVPGASPELYVEPRPGRLVLFPSYMWHGTVPIRGAEPRLTIAFDVVPGG